MRLHYAPSTLGIAALLIGLQSLMACSSLPGRVSRDPAASKPWELVVPTFEPTDSLYDPNINRVNDLDIYANNSISSPDPTRLGFNLSYYEIPASWLDPRGVDRLDPALVSLIYKNAQTARWFIHPKDEHHHTLIRERLERAGLPTEVKTLPIQAMRSASRSSRMQRLPHSPEQEFSIRISYTDGFGPWGGTEVEFGNETYAKGIDLEDALWAQELGRRIQSHPFPKDSNAVVLPDVATVGFADKVYYPNQAPINLAYSFRDLSYLLNPELRFAPGISSYHSEMSAIIATINGETDVTGFWSRSDAYARGQGMMDLMWDQATIMTSSHSQNMLSEMDRFYRPTGNLVLWDIGDSNLHPALQEVLDPADLTRLRSEFPMRAGLHEKFTSFKATDLPISTSWTHGSTRTNIDSEDVDRWEQAFKDGVLDRLSKRSGRSRKMLEEGMSSFHAQDGYYYVVFDSATPLWAELKSQMRRERVARTYAQPETRTGNSPKRLSDPVEEARLNHLLELLRSGSASDQAEALRESPEAMAKALLIHRLDERSWRSEAPPLVKELEAAFRAGHSSPIYTQSLVLLGSVAEDVLVAHLKYEGSHFTMGKAIEVLARSGHRNPEIQRALAGIFRNTKKANRAQRDMLASAISALGKLGAYDPEALRLAWAQASSARISYNAVAEAFSSCSRLPNEIAESLKNETLGAFRKVIDQGFGAVYFTPNMKMLARDPRNWPFIETELPKALQGEKLGLSAAETLKELTAYVAELRARSATAASGCLGIFAR